MIVVAGETDAEHVSSELEAAGETVHQIGRVEDGPRGCTVTGAGWSATHNA
jgi:phosphoribosylformylglycinamidine cyclo-ligase